MGGLDEVLGRLTAREDRHVAGPLVHLAAEGLALLEAHVHAPPAIAIENDLLRVRAPAFLVGLRLALKRARRTVRRRGSRGERAEEGSESLRRRRPRRPTGSASGVSLAISRACGLRYTEEALHRLEKGRPRRRPVHEASARGHRQHERQPRVHRAHSRTADRGFRTVHQGPTLSPKRRKRAADAESECARPLQPLGMQSLPGLPQG